MSRIVIPTFVGPSWRTQDSGGIPSSGLMGYWYADSDMSDGDSVTDHSGNGNTGTLNGGTATSGQYFDLTGSGEYIDIPSGNFHFVYPITLILWAKVLYGIRGLISYKYTGSGYSHWVLDTENANVRGLQSEGANSWVSDATASNTYNDAWRCIAYTNDGINARLYIDGDLEATDSTPATSTSSWSNGPIYVGYMYNNYWSYGYIDHIAIYNRALSETEIGQYMTATERT